MKRYLLIALLAVAGCTELPENNADKPITLKKYQQGTTSNTWYRVNYTCIDGFTYGLMTTGHSAAVFPIFDGDRLPKKCEEVK